MHSPESERRTATARLAGFFLCGDASGNVQAEEGHPGRYVPLPWSTHVGHIREAISDLLASFHGKLGVAERERDHEVTQLAEAIMEHGRMTQELYRNQRIVVDVKELAFRFREKSQTITKALVLLKQQGRARPTDLDGLWELQV